MDAFSAFVSATGVRPEEVVRRRIEANELIKHPAKLFNSFKRSSLLDLLTPHASTITSRRVRLGWLWSEPDEGWTGAAARCFDQTNNRPIVEVSITESIRVCCMFHIQVARRRCRRWTNLRNNNPSIHHLNEFIL